MVKKLLLKFKLSRIVLSPGREVRNFEPSLLGLRCRKPGPMMRREQTILVQESDDREQREEH